MGKTGRRLGGALAVPLMMVLVACGTSDGPDKSGKKDQRPQLALAVTPAENAQNVPVSTEVGVQVSNGKVSEVTLVDDQNKPVPGSMRPDGTSWVPDEPLKHKKTYMATVTATGEDGTSQSKTTTFTTMPEPRSRMTTSLSLTDGGTFGQAMPIVVEFDREIPESARKDVERRLFVTTEPPQPGAWGWYTGRQVLYRPQNYWQPGTKITVRSALGGHPLGGNVYGDTDRRATATISDTRTLLEVDNATKKMTVYQNDRPIRQMPVSLGKPSTPSSSGHMVIMSQERHTIFDTMNDPNPANRYRVPVEYAMRLTWGGEYIHSAPWSVYDQGRRNVSHGCVNLSPSNAAWLFSVTKIGDPVVVKGTEVRLDPGNGWTGWDVSWEQHLKRSALPQAAPADAAAAPTPPPPSPSPGD